MASIMVQFGLLVCSALPIGASGTYQVDENCPIPSVSRVEVVVDDGEQACPLYLDGTIVDGKVMVR